MLSSVCTEGVHSRVRKGHDENDSEKKKEKKLAAFCECKVSENMLHPAAVPTRPNGESCLGARVVDSLLVHVMISRKLWSLSKSRGGD